jgi:hypothetical protein
MELVHERAKQIPKAIREPALGRALHVADRLDDDHLAVDVELHGASRADCFERGNDLAGVVSKAELFEQRIARLPRDDDLGAGDSYEDMVHTTGPARVGHVAEFRKPIEATPGRRNGPPSSGSLVSLPVRSEV